MSDWAILTVALERDADVVAVRQRARRIAELLGFTSQDQTRIATAVSEIARNAVSYAGGGWTTFALSGAAAPQRLVIRVRDQGRGIDNLDQVLAGQFESPTGLGLGIVGARRLMDQFNIESSPNGGTTVTLDRRLPKGAAAVALTALAEIAHRLSAEATGDPLLEIQTQNQELLQSLDELRNRQDEAARLNVELENTNKGVVALYAELDQKALELQTLNATLEQRVAAAIAERERVEESLRQSQKMEAVGQLTGGLAHDFNNLLAAISGSLEMMATRITQGRTADVDRYMLAAQGATKRAAALTHRLLAFSRRQTLEPRPTDVNRLVSGMEELIRRTVGPQIEIDTVEKAGLWPVLADPNQLENALLNLCINARDAMPDGGKLTIETANRWLDDRAAKERDLPPGQYASLCVSDNGTGMPADVIERAFDPFFTTKPIGVGTGLGLSMIYGFARQSGGQVRIYSEVGQGTMVCVYLPRHHIGEVSLETATLEPVGQSQAGETVLVIDDEPIVRMLVVDVLQGLGYTALEASDGPSGLKVIRSDARIDLLITDVGLPNGMNGRQVVDAAREVRPNLKVLFVTGYAENAVLSHGHLGPGMQVVTKPFDMSVLASRIQRMLSEK